MHQKCAAASSFIIIVSCAQEHDWSWFSSAQTGTITLDSIFKACKTYYTYSLAPSGHHLWYALHVQMFWNSSGLSDLVEARVLLILTERLKFWPSLSGTYSCRIPDPMNLVNLLSSRITRSAWFGALKSPNAAAYLVQDATMPSPANLKKRLPSMYIDFHPTFGSTSNKSCWHQTICWMLNQKLDENRCVEVQLYA